MKLNATFNNSLVIWLLSVLLGEESRVPGWNHGRAASHWKTLHNERDSNSQL